MRLRYLKLKLKKFYLRIRLGGFCKNKRLNIEVDTKNTG